MSSLPDLPKKAIRCFFQAIFVLVLSLDGLAAGQTIGTITVVHGTVTIKRPGVPEAPARRSGEVFVGDVVRTTDNAAAQVALAEESFVDLAPNSAIRVSQYSFDQKEDRRTAVIRLLEGTARFIVYKDRKISSLRVESTFGLISSYGLADFVVTATNTETAAAVLNRSLQVKNSSSLVIGDVALGINQKTTVRERSAPTQPVVLSSDERKALLKLLSIR